MRWARSIRTVTVGAAVVAMTTAAMLGLGLAGALAAAGRDPQARPATVHSDVVATASGKVRGLQSTSYDQWLGIPYAADASGKARWTAPQPVAAWKGIREADQFSARCAQASGWDPGYEKVTTTENCLSLNVYVPHGAKGKLPVLAWIHGGGFTGGAGQDTDPRQFVDKGDAIVVTINYRLGALGYLNLPGLPEGGTFGLLDQQAALRWVQTNIANFGGDPRRVTIAGQSAGASSVCDQLASPTAKGLFSGAIIQSGGCSLTSEKDAQTASAKFVTEAGCTDASNVLNCLRAKPAADIVAAQQKAGVRPSVGGKAFPVDPATAVPAGQFSRVPVVVGQVSNERALNTFQNYDYLGKPITAAQYPEMVRDAYGDDADKILKKYPLSKYKTPGAAWTATQTDDTSATRQQLFRDLSKYVNTYAYEFAESSTPQFASIWLLQQKNEAARNFPFGATHVDDLPYLWQYLGQTLPFTDDQLELSDQMISYWSSFVTRQNPNSAVTPKWPVYKASDESIISLKACDTAPASTQPPAACSAASRDFSKEHSTAFWAAID